jgi:DNA-binding NtrC family response regulator
MMQDRPVKTFKQEVEALEQDLIERALRDCSGNISQSALYLGLNRTTLVEKMRKYATKLFMKELSYVQSNCRP